MKSKKVLIVENNDLQRKLFESLISQLYSFETVKNSISAVQKASQERFDLILMNIQMPDMDGITASKMIWQQSPYQCPILAIISQSADSGRDCFLEIGFADVITKPIRPKEFLEVISESLNSDEGQGSQLAERDTSIDILDKKVLHQLLQYNSIERIKSIYIEFLEECDHLISEIDTAFQEKNKQVLIESLHTIKGNSGTLGANVIYTLSGYADLKARSGDWDSFEIVLKKLKNECIIFEIYLAEESTFRL